MWTYLQHIFEHCGQRRASSTRPKQMKQRRILSIVLDVLLLEVVEGATVYEMIHTHHRIRWKKQQDRAVSTFSLLFPEVLVLIVPWMSSTLPALRMF